MPLRRRAPTASCTVRFTVGRTAVPGHAATARALGAHFLSFDLPPVRIAFDVSPLSHERTGVNNYIRGSLAGLAAAAQREGDEVVAFAPTSPRGRRAIPEALDGIPVELRLVTLPGAHALAHGVVAARLAAGRALARRASTCSTSRDWMYPPQRAGLRATTIHDLVPLHFPEWVTAADARDARAQVPRTRRAPAT